MDLCIVCRGPVSTVCKLEFSPYEKNINLLNQIQNCNVEFASFRVIKVFGEVLFLKTSCPRQISVNMLLVCASS